MSYEDFADLVLNNTAGYEIQEFKNGRWHVFRGRDIESFYARTDARLHEHKVFTTGGELVYHRDANGAVRIGSRGQQMRAKQKQTLGSFLIYGVRGKRDGALGDALKDGARRGLGIWGIGRRR